MSDRTGCIIFTKRVGIISILSIIISIVTVASSCWVYNRIVFQQNTPASTEATDLLYQVKQFFGGTTGLYDINSEFWLFQTITGTTMAASCVQCFMSICLVISTLANGRIMARIWVVVTICTILAIAGSLVTFYVNSDDLSIDPPIFLFLFVSATNCLLMTSFCIVVAIYSSR